MFTARQLQSRRTGTEPQPLLYSAEVSGTRKLTPQNEAHGSRLESGRTIGQKRKGHEHLTLATGNGHAPGCQRQALEKERANHMTIKEKLKVHREIERENKRKLNEWKKRN